VRGVTRCPRTSITVREAHEQTSFKRPRIARCRSFRLHQTMQSADAGAKNECFLLGVVPHDFGRFAWRSGHIELAALRSHSHQ
jgi:hypothetical protein